MHFLFPKHNIPTDQYLGLPLFHATQFEPFYTLRVSQKHAFQSLWLRLSVIYMSIDHTPKQSQIFHAWRMNRPHFLNCLHPNSNKGVFIDQISNCHYCFNPKMLCIVSIRKQEPNSLHDYPIHHFSKPILLRNSSNCLVPSNPIFLAKFIKLFRSKFQPIMSSKSLDFSTNLGLYQTLPFLKFCK